MAKHSRNAEDWKHYLGQLRREKTVWKGERVQRAAQDWRTYRQFTKQRGSWGDEFMAKCEQEDPVRRVAEHFREVFHDERVGDIEGTLLAITRDVVNDREIVLFTEAEVREAILKGKNGRAVGPDLVPVELLKSMAESPVSMCSLTAFFNRILMTGDTPREWDVSIATLIPKLCPPRKGKTLEAYCLGLSCGENIQPPPACSNGTCASTARRETVCM